MRVALIATGERGAAPAPLVSGRSLVLRQLDFARAWGAERVIAYGNGVREDADALEREITRAGLGYTPVANAHALVAAVGWPDALLVLQSGVLPEVAAAAERLRQGPGVLAFAAREADDEQFERIDADELWAGALVVPGELVDRLTQLPEDADPSSALLRIALQARLPVERLPASKGAWLALRQDADMADLHQERLRRLVSSLPPVRPTQRLVAWAFSRFALPLTHRRYTLAGALTVLLLLSIGALLAARFQHPSSAFAALALTAPALYCTRLIDRVKRPSLAPPRLPHWLDRLPDAMLFAVTVLSIEGAWYRRLFPPLVLLIALARCDCRTRWRTLAGDRALGALAIACAALAGWHEPALMAWALLAFAAGGESRSRQS